VLVSPVAYSGAKCEPGTTAVAISAADLGYSLFVVLKGKVRVSAGDEVLTELAALFDVNEM